MMKHFLLITLLFLSTTSFAQKATTVKPLKLWFNEPAKQWEATLPLGNGRLGAMPDGGIVNEKIILNDITLWSGGPEEADRPGALDFLPQIRNLIFQGKNSEAEALVNKNFVCLGKGTGSGRGATAPYGSFQLLGNLNLTFDFGVPSGTEKVTGYYRELSLNNAVALCRFKMGETTYTREYFTSFSGDVVVIRLTAEQGVLNFSAALDRPERATMAQENQELTMSGQLTGNNVDNGMRYISRLRILNEGGTQTIGNNQVIIKGARSALLLISSATDYRNTMFTGTSETLLRDSAKKSYADLKKEHIAAYKKLFDRVKLDIPAAQPVEMPTDQRLNEFAKTLEDTDFVVLYYQYGRYLLISSARPGLLPPNLQGLWSNTIQTPWNGDYHLNINVQMNHWPVEAGNLAELHTPLFDLIERMVEPGTKTAQVYYGAKGWVAHSITNLWSFTAPGEKASWGSTNTGAAWICSHLWDHYAFSQDKEFLWKAYPVMKGSAEFFLSILQPEPIHGWLVTVPTTSPENAFVMADGTRASICAGSTMDNQLVRELFTNVINSSEILGFDAEFRKQLQNARSKLPPTQIGKEGQILEWLEEYQENEPTHRHISHLYGLHPSNQITPLGTPELAKAARVTLERRGDGATGWSRAWKINFWARLGDGNRAYKLLGFLMTPTAAKDNTINTSAGGSYPNLFCAHPPFQIDGNFGGAAGIAEMLLQSHAGFIEFLPALPDQWKSGNFEGLRVRGGAEVALVWTGGRIKEATLKATAANTFQVRVPAYASKAVLTRSAKKETLAANKGLVSFALQRGEQVRLVFE